MTPRKPLWVFTPSRTDPKDLEYINVQREDILQHAVERVRDSALTGSKHHQLFVGPRGSGKTHLITLIVHRVGQDAELNERLRVAWLNEDETCTTLLELLLKVHGALEKRYPKEYSEEALAPVFDRKPDQALKFVQKHLLDTLVDRTLLIVAENLDAIFEGLGDAGQKKLRAFLQEHPRFSLVASAQKLVDDLADRRSPFFGFFQTEHLKPLHVGEATELLRKIAQLQGAEEVAQFLVTSRGRARVRALHHLSGGNHRIYLVLSQFITKDGIDDLVIPFQKMMDELTPYYQERMRWLPPLQRKIVEYLCTCETTVPVKDIARRLFSTPQTISSQLQELREKGYLESNQRGREALYEISEPLMRICIEVKDNQNYEPLRLLVDFLRIWYEDSDLDKRFRSKDSTELTKAYLQCALERNQAQGNLRKRWLLADLRQMMPAKLSKAEREHAERVCEELPESFTLGVEHLWKGEREEAMKFFEEALQADGSATAQAEVRLARGRFMVDAGDMIAGLEDFSAVIAQEGTSAAQVARALNNRGVVFHKSNEVARAIEDFSAVISLKGTPVEQLARALNFRGFTFSQSDEMARAMDDFSAVISLENVPLEHLAWAFVQRGNIWDEYGESEPAMQDYSAVLALKDAPPDQLAWALYKRGRILENNGDDVATLEAYNALIALKEAPIDIIAWTLVNRGDIYEKAGDHTRAIEDYSAVIALKDAPAVTVAMALQDRAHIFEKNGDNERAIEDYSAVISLKDVPPSTVAWALNSRGDIFEKNGDDTRAVEDYSAIIALKDAPPATVAWALNSRGDIFKKNGDHAQALEDYSNVVALKDAPIDQVARALNDRGLTFRKIGDISREIEEYSTVIDLQSAPIDELAWALNLRGLALGESGDIERAMKDYSAVIDLQGAPIDELARAHNCRGIVFGISRDRARAIEEYSAVIALEDAPVDQVTWALKGRGLVYLAVKREKEAQADFESILHMAGVTPSHLVDASNCLAELHFSQGRWVEGMKTLDSSFIRVPAKTRDSHGDISEFISPLFSGGLSMDTRNARVAELFSLYKKHEALSPLGEGLVRHLGNVFQKGPPFPSADNLDQWIAAWESAAADVEDFRLSLRLLRTAVEFIKKGGKDHGVLLTLTKPEREILMQAFGLSEGAE